MAPKTASHTFADAVAAFLVAKAPGWRNAKHRAQWSSTLSHHTAALLPMPIAKISTVHGCRSAFRDWAGDQTSFPREIAEEALAQSTGNAVELSYRRFDALEKRRKLMEAWANFCEPKAASNVLSMTRLKASQ